VAASTAALAAAAPGPQAGAARLEDGGIRRWLRWWDVGTCMHDVAPSGATAPRKLSYTIGRIAALVAPEGPLLSLSCLFMVRGGKEDGVVRPVMAMQ
jgi:hypothetical protein